MDRMTTKSWFFVAAIAVSALVRAQRVLDVRCLVRACLGLAPRELVEFQLMDQLVPFSILWHIPCTAWECPHWVTDSAFLVFCQHGVLSRDQNGNFLLYFHHQLIYLLLKWSWKVKLFIGEIFFPFRKKLCLWTIDFLKCEQSLSKHDEHNFSAVNRKSDEMALF